MAVNKFNHTLALIAPGDARTVVNILAGIVDMNGEWDCTIEPWAGDPYEWIAVVGTRKVECES